jgi:aspartate/methionine/tyrosine aminotransferase
MIYKRMPIEKESPEEMGYDKIVFNLAESSVVDLRYDELNISFNDLKLEYVAHAGNVELRKLIASETNKLNESDVLLTCGAAGALFIINTSLLTSNDHLIVIRPNYATNIEVPVAIGSSIDYIDLKFEENWRVNIDAIESVIKPNTKLISITTPHNPTGMMMSEVELHRIAKIAEERNLFLLVDETYRDAMVKTSYPVMASVSGKIISVSSLSKAYGLPGLRIGWLITTDKTLMEKFLAAKEMIHISNSALDEEVALQFYRQKEKFLESINKRVAKNFDVLKQWFHSEPNLETILPQGGVVCFPRFKQPGEINISEFYSTLMHKYKTMVGPGHWFSMPDSYMRIGFGWVDEATLVKGLENISLTIEECKM